MPRRDSDNEIDQMWDRLLASVAGRTEGQMKADQDSREAWIRHIARLDCLKWEAENQMKITKDGKYVTRKDKYPVEILATDMGGVYPILARYLQPVVGWKVLRYDECGRYALGYSRETDLIEAPTSNYILKKICLTDSGTLRFLDKMEHPMLSFRHAGDLVLEISGNEIVSGEVTCR